MSRSARFIEPKGFYHIISRALNDTWIFRDTTDFDRFIVLELTAKNKYPILLFHYVLMNTHFHMLVQAYNHRVLSEHISYLKWHYTMWMRRKYGWKGPLWKERYKSLPVENEDYLYSCGMYIEYNPVRAGICNDPGDYPFSSYQKRGFQISEALIDKYEIGNNSKKLIQLNYDLDLTKNIFSLSPAIGSAAFIKRIKCLSQK